MRLCRTGSVLAPAEYDSRVSSPFVLRVSGNEENTNGTGAEGDATQANFPIMNERRPFAIGICGKVRRARRRLPTSTPSSRSLSLLAAGALRHRARYDDGTDSQLFLSLWIRMVEGRVVSANAERSLAAVEDERDDQVLLVAQVARELAEQHVARRRVAVGRAAQRVGIGGRPEEGVRALHRAFDRLMDHPVVGFEHVEAAGEPRLGRLEHGEEMQVLDLMVGVELLEEELQPRRKPGAQVLRRRGPGAKRLGRLLQRGPDL